jgi:hypothetical protein
VASENLAQRARIEQWLSHPTCERNTASAVLGVPLHLLPGASPSREASQLAGWIGNAFEASLFEERFELLEKLMKEAGLLTEEIFLIAKDKEDLIGLELQLELSKNRLAEMLPASSKKAYIFRGFRLPANLFGDESAFEIDLLLAVPISDTQYELIIGEVKVYPAKAGRTNPGQIAGARAQAGLYAHILADWLNEHTELTNVVYNNKGFLVFTNPVDGKPLIAEVNSLFEQRSRANLAIQSLTNVKNTRSDWAAIEKGKQEDKLTFLEGVSTDSGDGCWSFCSLAHRCFKDAVSNDNTIVLGSQSANHLSRIPLSVALQLADGALEPQDEVEAELRQRIAEADFDELEVLPWHK